MNPNRTLSLTPLAIVKTSKQEFLDKEQLLPLGVATVFAGRGAGGKSTLALDYAAKVATGRLEGEFFGTPRPVLICQHEDDPGIQLKPRLIAAGVAPDSEMIQLLKVRDLVGGQETFDLPSLTRDIELIRQAIEEVEPALIIFDPLTSVIEGDLNKVQDVRQALNPLTALAQHYGLALICVMHVNKGGGSSSDRTSGSHAFRDVARSLLLFANDPESGNRVVTVDKSSYSQREGDSFAFKLLDTEIPTDDGKITNVARVEYLGESEKSVQHIWDEERNAGDVEERNEVELWLTEFLQDRGGKARSNDIFTAAREERFHDKRVQRAGKKLADKRRDGFQGGTVWILKSLNKDNQDTGQVPTPEMSSMSSMPETLACLVCGGQLHPLQAELGTHPSCDPEGKGRGARA